MTPAVPAGRTRWALAAIALAGAAAPLTAQGGPGEEEASHPALTVSGYIRSITTLHDLGFDLPDVPGAPDRERGFHGEVVRVKWVLEGSRWRVDVHNRAQVRVTSEPGAEPVLGFGVGSAPDRLVDLRFDFLNRDRVMAWHDLDRLSATLHTPLADLTLGRQPITWGISSLFPVADLWATFGPFEQDTEEKPGIDAARALIYSARGAEIDAVLAYRGSLEDLSAGIRSTFTLPAAELWAGAGKFWRQLMVMGGATVLGDQSRWRAEAVLPYDLDGGQLQRPRITVGADRIRSRSVLAAEYHFNGIGATDADRYAVIAADPRVRRGESYYLGRHYLGGLVTWSPDPDTRLNLALNTLVNLGDPSAVFAPAATYDVGQASRISVGALVSAGARPAVQADPPFLLTGSEFGLYGHALFTMVSIYY